MFNQESSDEFTPGLKLVALTPKRKFLRHVIERAHGIASRIQQLQILVCSVYKTLQTPQQKQRFQTNVMECEGKQA